MRKKKTIRLCVVALSNVFAQLFFYLEKYVYIKVIKETSQNLFQIFFVTALKWLVDVKFFFC